MTYRIGVYPVGQCPKTKDRHEVGWDYKGVIFDGDCVRLYGECSKCGLEFEKTFQQTEGLTVVAKSSRNAFDFNKEVIEIN